MTLLRRDPSNVLLFGFLTLLVVLVIQVGWLVADLVRDSRSVQRQIATLYRADAEVVTEFLQGRAPLEIELEQSMPHLELGAGDARVRSAALAELERATAARSNRYLWEGAFLLVVLLGGMAILSRAILHDRELRRRQQNFLAAVSHEFKSPLASIRLAAETLLMRAKEPETRRLAQRILEDDERLLRMVENLLDTTRLEEGRTKLERKRVRVERAAAAAIGELGERAAAGGITITADIDPELELEVDPGALDTILRNLLDNSIKACAAGDGRSITISARRHAGRIELAVADDGIGFPPEDAAMIFEKFHRLGDEQRRATAGSGLGLYIVRRLVELSGASIRAMSAGPGRGANVTIAWPEETAR